MTEKGTVRSIIDSGINIHRRGAWLCDENEGYKLSLETSCRNGKFLFSGAFYLDKKIPPQSQRMFCGISFYL